MKRLLPAILLLALAGCANFEVGIQTQGTLPRGFSQQGSPYPYNAPGW